MVNKNSKKKENEKNSQKNKKACGRGQVPIGGEGAIEGISKAVLFRQALCGADLLPCLMVPFLPGSDFGEKIDFFNKKKLEKNGLYFRKCLPDEKSIFFKNILTMKLPFMGKSKLTREEA